MLYRKFQLENKQIAIWHIAESKEELLQLANPCDSVLEEIRAIRSEKRQIEKLATSCLLRELLSEDFKLTYARTGKPQLSDSAQHISISHSGDFVAVALSDVTVGIDIQRIDMRVRRLRSRFVSADEFIDPQSELVHLLLHWSAKEAMFKWLNLEEVDLIRHLHVEPFTPAEKGQFQVCETKTFAGTKLSAHYETDEKFVLVVVQ